MNATGKIMLVGIGPGHVEHMTQRAREAIAEADTSPRQFRQYWCFHLV